MLVSEAHGAKISHGERVAAMIMNGLGFIDSRLYLFPEFLSDKPLDRLFNRHVKPEWFNDDASGRYFSLRYTELCFAIGQSRGLLGKRAYIDTTAIESDNNNILWPKQGYAKSGRHDLKQMLLLATTRAANFPLWIGNASFQKTMPAAAVKINKLCRDLANAPDFFYVGDSAIYANILQHSANEVGTLIATPEEELTDNGLCFSLRQPIIMKLRH